MWIEKIITSAAVTAAAFWAAAAPSVGFALVGGDGGSLEWRITVAWDIARIVGLSW